MIKIEKTFGVRGVEDNLSLLRLQELIVIARDRYGLVGKAVIDAEKITFFKFGLKLGVSYHAPNGIVLNENGIVRYIGMSIPRLYDRQIMNDLSALFRI